MSQVLPSVHFGVRWYGLTIFLSSACLMVLEISAARLLAPYVGVSLYSWTAIIGVILAGLSTGNWLGGLWADRNGSEQSAGVTLALAALASFTVLLLLNIIAPFIQDSQLDLLSSSFIFVLALFFLPSLLLGVVTPLLTTLALRVNKRPGHVIGGLHALAAMGSILGTFVTGYWLVQYFGTRFVIIGTAALLLLLAIPLLWYSSRKIQIGILCGTLILSVIGYTRNVLSNPCDVESRYYCIRVVDESARAPFGEARGMVLDHLIHGISHDSEPGMLIPPYMHLMDELVLDHFELDGNSPSKPLRFFFVGGGSYTQPRAVQALYPSAHISVAELDPLVTQIAATRLYLDTQSMHIYHGDGRVILQQLKNEKFDVIVGDVFHDIAIPYHLTTLEYTRLIKERLNHNGIYTMNAVDVFPNPKLIKSLVKTLNQVFNHVHVWIDSLPEQQQRMTFVISATDTREPSERIQSRRGFNRLWYRMTEPVLSIGTELSTLPVLTDDAVPVERLISDLIFSDLGR